MRSTPVDRPPSDRDRSVRQLDRAGAALTVPDTTATTAGVFHLLANGYRPGEIAAVFEDLPDDFMQRLARDACAALDRLDLAEFDFAAEVVRIAGDEPVATTFTRAGLGFDTDRIAGWLAARVDALDRPTTLVLEGTTDHPHHRARIVDSDDMARSELVSNRNLPSGHTLCPDQVDALVRRGWHLPSGSDGDYWRVGIGGDERHLALGRVLDALFDVYGIPADEPIRATFTH